MGIPAAFRWLSNKYPKIISPAFEERPIIMDDGTTIPVDATRPNPNGEEFDNLYLDMNGIVHPCSHPEDKPAPANEEEMMMEIFKYTDRVVSLVRPRKVFIIAVDGVAPRAKMNQQRSRRFRAAREAKEKEEIRQELFKVSRTHKGESEDQSGENFKNPFDSNSITPGTPFMDVLASSLRYWCAYKLNTDPAWAKLKVIISDATVPGEGEHKIMAFIRSQRASPDYDPNTRHVLYGLDADLIMLGLATHEPHFRVLREDVFHQEEKSRLCRLCGQAGHIARLCTGAPIAKKIGDDGMETSNPPKPFIWLHVARLREYLAIELHVPGLPFPFDLERAIDDWIFLCCFVGNDFLPHLPALEIREDGIITLTSIWKRNLPSMGGYVTKDGHIDFGRAQWIMDGLASQESSIFKRRKEAEDRRDANAKRRKLQSDARNGYSPDHIQVTKPAEESSPVLCRPSSPGSVANLANRSAASLIRGQILHAENQNAYPLLDTCSTALPTANPSGRKRKATALDDPPSVTARGEAIDSVRLWEDGYADRYYEHKFHVDAHDKAFRRQVALKYAEGLAWVLLYYLQGCPSWEWFYPFHYAPFAEDFKQVGEMSFHFEVGQIARPFEQLMSVLPAASRHALPEIFHDLMTNTNSDIIDFYPENFAIDLNGKKMEWQGVALLPFIEMPRLLSAVQKRYPLLEPRDAKRNGVGEDVLLISDLHQALYNDLTKVYWQKKLSGLFSLNSATSDGLVGLATRIEDHVPHGALRCPLESRQMPDIDYDRSLSVHYSQPVLPHSHKSMLLRGVNLPPPFLSPSDIELLRSKLGHGHRDHGQSYSNRVGNMGTGRNNMPFAPGGGMPFLPPAAHVDHSRFREPYRSGTYPTPGISGWPQFAGQGLGAPPLPPPPAFVRDDDRRRPPGRQNTGHDRAQDHRAARGRRR